MSEKKIGRTGFEGVIHTWKIPSDIETLFREKGISWIWDAVRQYASIENMEQRYILRPLGACQWEVRDTRTQLSVRFVEGLLDSTKKVDSTKFVGEEPLIKAGVEQLCDYVRNNKPTLATCNISMRMIAISKISTKGWFHLVIALSTFLNDGKTGVKLALRSEMVNYFAYECNVSSEESHGVLDEIDRLSVDEAAEVLAEVELFWFATEITFVQWIKDIREWHTYVDKTSELCIMENKLYALTTERLRGYVKDNWRKRLDINKGSYIDTLRHYNDDIDEVYDSYLQQVEEDEELNSRAQSYLSALEEMLEVINKKTT